MNQNHMVRLKQLPLLIAVLLASTGHAGVVRNDIDYQAYFRDLAENKGMFFVGASSIPVFNNQGEAVGTMLDGVPMPDLRSASRRDAVAVMVSPQFAATVSHNVGIQNLQFGGEDHNPDSHHFNYKQVSKHNDSNNPKVKTDYQVIRLNKLVTEVEPTQMSEAGLTAKPYADRSRFSHFIRLGSGYQLTRPPNMTNNKNDKWIGGAYKFVTGGVPLGSFKNDSKQGSMWTIGDVYENVYGPMASQAAGGDSGSPLFGYDKKLGRWVLVGHAQALGGVNNIYALSRPSFFNGVDRGYILDVPRLEKDNDVIKWFVTSGDSIISTKQQAVSAGKVTSDNLDAAKSLHFSGPSGILQLEDSVNHGAGALYFNSDFIVQGKTGQESWLGAGVSVGDYRTVHWRVKNPKGDRLSKVGNGNLYVDGKGVNEGDISVGAGTVILGQSVDEHGRVQAFNKVGLVSGRGTIRIVDNRQFNPDNFYFGFRGGRLDLNGNSLTFNRIQNTDDGARIVNQHPTKEAELVIGGTKPAKSSDITWQRWGTGASNDLTLYEYVNNHRGNRLDYFLLRKNPKSWFPIDANSSSDWEFLGHNKKEAERVLLSRYSAVSGFDGYLGEVDPKGRNGKLNVTYRPNDPAHRLLLTGGMRLNGNFKLEAGEVMLSGKPVPHAYDHTNGKEIIDEWQDRWFEAKRFDIHNDSHLSVGRNVSRVAGQFNVYNHGKLTLGFVEGQTPSCIRSDHTGKVSCQTNLSQEELAKLPNTQIRGSVYLHNNANLHLGKANLHASVHAYDATNTTLHKGSSWTMTGDSYLGNLHMHQGSQITLNPKYHSLTAQEQNLGLQDFHTLNILGNLSGTGRFNFLSHAKLGLGDVLNVKGLAQGSFALNLKNTGAEPYAENPLTLVNLSNANQDAKQVNFYLADKFVDLGAYRYVLARTGNQYHLFNPVLVAKKQAKVADDQKRQQLTQEKDAYHQQVNRLTQDLYAAEQNKQHLNHQIGDKKSLVKKERDLARRHLDASTKWYHTWPKRHREKALADQANQRADQLEREIGQLNLQLSERQQKLSDLNARLTDAKSHLKTTDHAIRLLDLGSLDANGTIKRGAQETCIGHNVAPDACQAISYNPTELIVKEEDRLNGEISKKSQEKQTVNDQINSKKSLVKKERDLAKRHLDASTKWYHTWPKRHREKALADQANQRADQLEREIEDLKSHLGHTDVEIRDLQDSLNMVRSLKNTQNISADQEALISASMGNTTQLSQDYQDAKQAYQLALDDFKSMYHSLSAEQIKRIEADLDKAKYALDELEKELITAYDHERKLLELLLGKMERNGGYDLIHAQDPSLLVRQADVVSQFANTALSELSVQANHLRQTRQGLHRQLTSFDRGFVAWVNHQHQDAKYDTQFFRPYRQKTNLTQFGLEVPGDALRTGLAFSYVDSDNHFDDQFMGATKTKMLTAYVKKDLGQQTQISLDASYGRSHNTLSKDDIKVAFDRDNHQLGLTATTNLSVSGLNIKPSLGLNYNHLDSVSYQLDGADIQQKSLGFWGYQAGLQLSKTFEVGEAVITPSLESHYVSQDNKQMRLQVNQRALTQEFSDGLHHELGVTAKVKNWSAQAYVGLDDDKQADSQKYAGIKINYQW